MPHELICRRAQQQEVDRPAAVNAEDDQVGLVSAAARRISTYGFPWQTRGATVMPPGSASGTSVPRRVRAVVSRSAVPPRGVTLRDRQVVERRGGGWPRPFQHVQEGQRRT